MPLNHKAKQPDGYVLVIGSGTLAIEEYEELNRLIEQDSSCNGLDRRLYDMRLVEPAETYQRQEALHKRTTAISCNRMAILVSSPAAYGMARIYQTVASEQLPVEIFYEEPQAVEWLLQNT